MKNLKTIIGIAIIIVVLVGGYLWLSSPRVAAEPITTEKVTVYKALSCGCCDNYIGYLKRQGLDVEKINKNEMNEIKEQYNIPQDMESCHTTIIGDYVIEGHIPIEVIAKLLKEKPDIRGIAMPGMPSGSPGMPGPKEEFIIYSLLNDGGTEIFMSM